MKNKSSCNRLGHERAISTRIRSALLTGICLAGSASLAVAGDAPQWMHAVVNAQLPDHDEKTDAVLLYSERNVTVQSIDKVRTHVRVAYKVIRPGGRDYGVALVSFNAHTKINGLKGWCIPAQGKDYEIKDKEGLEVSLPKVEGSELISGVRAKVLQIPAADPGNIVGYEYDGDEQPMVLQEVWSFQREVPGRELHFSLQLPAGWEYKATWINYPESKPALGGGNQWEWVVSNVKAIRKEAEMPPIEGVAGQMIVSYFPPSGASLNGFSSWQEMGKWYLNL